MSTDQTEWSSRQLLDWMRGRFQAADVDAPRVVAETLLAKAFACSRLHLHMHPERPASPDERECLREDVRRVLSGEPLHYITGQVQFWHGTFFIRPCTQIPQPCTELLVSHTLTLLAERGHALGHGRRAADSTFDPDFAAAGPQEGDSRLVQQQSSVVDALDVSQEPGSASSQQPPLPTLNVLEAGVGSGAVIVSLLQSLPNSLGVGVDVEPECLNLARENAHEMGVAERLQLMLHDVKVPLSGAYDIVVGNLPYIPDREWPHNIDPGVLGFTPESALRGGADGLDVIRPFVGWVAQVMRSDGIIGLEHASESAADVALLLEQAGFSNVASLPDEDGLLRCTFGVWPGASKSVSEG